MSEWMPDRYQIRIMPSASGAVVEICGYIERQSPQNATTVAKRLFAAIDSLEIMPHRFKVHEHRKDASKTVHAMSVPPFIIYYRVLDGLRVVEVVSIIHGSRRQPRRFP